RVRWPSMLLLVAACATLAFAAKLWAAALRPRSTVVLRPAPPLLPTPARPHLTAPRVVVPASPSVAAQLGISAGGRPARGSTAGGSQVNTSTSQPGEASPPQPIGA